MNTSEPPQIRLKIDSFRAVKSADIIIDGITVVTGENGCGKSTLSKLLYFFYKTVSDYDLLVSQAARKDLIGPLYLAADFLRLCFSPILPKPRIKESQDKKEDEDYEWYENSRLLFLDFHIGKNKEFILSKEKLQHFNITFNQMEKVFEEFSLDKKQESETEYKLFFNGLKQLQRDMKVLLNEKREEELSPRQIIPKIKELIDSKFIEAFDKMQSRPANLFWNGFEKFFSEKNKPNLEIYEYEEQLISPEKKDLSRSFAVDKVIYIDTPMAINVKDQNDYWDDLNNLLETKDKSPLFQENKHSNLSDLISNEIIKGEASFKNDVLSSKFSFNRADGKTFDLMECATGIKSFSILQILLKNGSLTNKTLLIIDEPESHLHPQWIVEYARILVLLNKQIGVKIFLASHDPDFVRAIKQISEEQETIENINFYLAEESNTDFSYNYKHTDKDINTIFASFNKSLEAIDKYSGL